MQRKRGRGRAAATGVGRDGVLPGGRDEAMSAPQKNTLAVGDHHRHGCTKRTRGPFRCVSNTKQWVLCSLVLASAATCARRPADKGRSRQLSFCFDECLIL